jgi:hypothetical protein
MSGTHMLLSGLCAGCYAHCPPPPPVPPNPTLPHPVHRTMVETAAQDTVAQVAVFLNSVPLLNTLDQEQKMMLVDALEERSYEAGNNVVQQGNQGGLGSCAGVLCEWCWDRGGAAGRAGSVLAGCCCCCCCCVQSWCAVAAL